MAKRKRPVQTPTKPRAKRASRSGRRGASPARGGARSGAGAPLKLAPPELIKKLEHPQNADELLDALASIGLLSAKGVIAASSGKLCLELAREARQVLVKLKSKEAPAGVLTNAIDILTPRERALVDADRKARTPPPMKPGEAIAPPSDSPAPDDARSAPDDTGPDPGPDLTGSAPA